jgi:hypothetical protein
LRVKRGDLAFAENDLGRIVENEVLHGTFSAPLR